MILYDSLDLCDFEELCRILFHHFNQMNQSLDNGSLQLEIFEAATPLP